MSTQYVKYNIETGKIEAGPQEHKPNDSWVMFQPAGRSCMGKTVAYGFDEHTQTVTQYIIGDKDLSWRQERLRSYPKIGDQFDKLFHDITNGTLTADGEWYQSIQAVKDAIPKTEETDGD